MNIYDAGDVSRLEVEKDAVACEVLHPKSFNVLSLF